MPSRSTKLQEPLILLRDFSLSDTRNDCNFGGVARVLCSGAHHGTQLCTSCLYRKHHVVSSDPSTFVTLNGTFEFQKHVVFGGVGLCVAILQKGSL